MGLKGLQSCQSQENTLPYLVIASLFGARLDTLVCCLCYILYLIYNDAGRCDQSFLSNTIVQLKITKTFLIVIYLPNRSFLLLFT